MTITAGSAGAPAADAVIYDVSPVSRCVVDCTVHGAAAMLRSSVLITDPL